MKRKITLIIMSVLLTVFATSCGKPEPEKDSNGQTPKDVVDQMYKAIQQGDIDAAMACCSVPETLIVKHKKDENGNVEKETVTNNHERVRDMMMVQTTTASYKQLKSWDLKEEGDKVDPNSAKVKATVVFINKEGKEEVVNASFPMKRKGVWKING